MSALSWLTAVGLQAQTFTEWQATAAHAVHTQPKDTHYFANAN